MNHFSLFGASFYSLLFLITFCMSSMLWAQAENVERILNPDGTIQPGHNGSYSVSGYQLAKGENGQPRLIKEGGAKGDKSVVTWSGYGSGRNGTNYDVNAIAVSGSDVYIGGGFKSVDDIPANYIVKWNGSSWSALADGSSNGLNGAVNAIAISGTDVYVGGYFNKFGDETTSANYIAKWSTTTNTWSTLPFGATNGVSNLVSAIVVSGTDIYVGGQFYYFGDETTSAKYIAKWSTTTNTWSTLPYLTTNGVSGNVNALAVSGTDVYVGGAFSTLGNGYTSAKYIAKWSTTTNTWSTLASGTSNGVGSTVYALAVYGTDIYVGGSFSTLGNGTTTANRIAKWSTTTNTWSVLPYGSTNGVNSNVLALAVSGTDIYVAGAFYYFGNESTTASRIAKWSTTTNTWSVLPSGASNGVNTVVYALGVCGTNIYVGGGFTKLGDGTTCANYIAKWSTTSSTLSSITTGGTNGVLGSVNAIAIYGTDIYLGGEFSTVGCGAISAKNIVKWSTATNTWSVLPSGASNGVNNRVYALAVYGTDIYVGGDFTKLGNGTTWANRIAKWSTTTNTWSVLPRGSGDGVNNSVFALAVCGTDIYVGGYFNYLGDGSTSANKIAKWSTTTNTWSTLPSGSSNGVNNSVKALAVSGTDIYAAGDFSYTGDGTTSIKCIAKWSTTTNTWSSLPCGSSNGVGSYVYALAVCGTDIFVGGMFSTLGDGTTSAKRIAKWSTTTNTWSVLPCGASNGVNSDVRALAVYGDDVYIGGLYSTLGDGTTTVNRIVIWNNISSSWTSFTDGIYIGVNGPVTAFLVDDVRVKMISGGSFTNAGQKAIYGIGEFKLQPRICRIDVKAVIQGFYNSLTGKMRMKDTLSIYLANSTTPYALVDTAAVIIDSATFRGEGDFPKAGSGSYYIVLKHRNSLETWSANPVSFTKGSTTSFSFTDAAARAHTGNQILIDSLFCIYNGDVNQDGIINKADLILVDNDAANYTSGFVDSDLTGDRTVDLSDLVIVDNNAFNQVTVHSPATKIAEKQINEARPKISD